MAAEIKTVAELNELGRTLRAQLEAGLTKEWDTLERPYPMVAMLLADHHDSMDLRSHDLESLLDAYVGTLAANWVEKYLQLHADLTRHGYVSTDNSLEFGNDAYVWAIAEREVAEPELDQEVSTLLSALIGKVGRLAEDSAPSMRHAKAIVLETQSRNFLLVFNERFGRWGLHVREFWVDVRDELADDGYVLDLDDIKDRKDLTILDVVRYSTLASRYSDAMPGVSYPERPSLATLLGGNLMAGEDGAGIGLRYGDGRDRGYVMSFRPDLQGRHQAKDMAWGSYATMGYVAVNMASALCVMEDEHPTDGQPTPET